MKKFFALFLLLMLSQCAFSAVIFKSSNLYGLKDDENNIILNAQYQEISQMEYTPSKTILIPMQATNEAEIIKTDFYKIKKNNRYGIANVEGKILHNCEYDDVKLNDNGEIVLINDNIETLANPIKNTMKNTRNTVESIIGLPVTIIAGVMIPIEMISKMGRK